MQDVPARKPDAARAHLRQLRVRRRRTRPCGAADSSSSSGRRCPGRTGSRRRSRCPARPLPAPADTPTARPHTARGTATITIASRNDRVPRFSVYQLGRGSEPVIVVGSIFPAVAFSTVSPLGEVTKPCTLSTRLQPESISWPSGFRLRLQTATERPTTRHDYDRRVLRAELAQVMIHVLVHQRAPVARPHPPESRVVGPLARALQRRRDARAGASAPRARRPSPRRAAPAARAPSARPWGRAASR